MTQKSMGNQLCFLGPVISSGSPSDFGSVLLSSEIMWVACAIDRDDDMGANGWAILLALLTITNDDADAWALAL